jgi:hypothetical protein
MIRFLLRRVLTMAVTLAIISALVFFIIKLPPGDFLTNQIAELRAQGEAASAAKAEFLIRQYGLDRPVWEQYLVWIGVWPNPEGVFSGLHRRRLGLVLRIRQARQRGRRRRALAHPAGQFRGRRLRPYRGDPDRDLLGDAAILGSATTPRPSSAISGSRPRASSWR